MGFVAGALVLLAHPDGNAPALAGLVGTFLHGLLAWALGLIFTGVVLAAASASLFERVALKRMTERTFGWLVGAQPLMRYRLVRGLIGTAIGAALIFWPTRALSVLGLLGGMVIAFVGMREAFFAALHLLPDFEPKAARANIGFSTMS